MATEEQLRQIVLNHNGGEWIEKYSAKIGTAKIYEIWTRTTTTDDRNRGYAAAWRKGDIPQTRFVFEEHDGSKLYFEYFEDLADHLDKCRNAINAPADLSIGQLIGGLSPAEFYAVLGAIVLAIGGVFFLGAKLGVLFGW
jgi:hypothetical protein